MEIVNTYNLVKKYGEIYALDGLNLSINKGELFGLIGADGAGKTTVFRILTSLILPDSGDAKILNLDIKEDYKEIRKNIGYMPGKFSLYLDLSVYENLKFFASVFGISIEENMDIIYPIYKHLEKFKDRKAGKLSGGMKQKLALSCALIHKPKILFLDEPTTGVDPVSRKEFWEMLKMLKNQGITIIVSTPYMDEANMCDRIALMRKGKLMSINSPKNIIKDFGEVLYEIKSDNMYQLLNDIREFKNTKRAYTFGVSHHLILEKDSKDEILEYLKIKNHKNIFINRVEPNIEDCYLQIESLYE